MGLEIRPADRSRWDELAGLFGPSGIARGCWCMGRRLAGKEFAANSGDQNRDALRALVDAGTQVGLLGYLDGEPIAWCAVAPRPAYRIVASRTLPIDAPDDPDVWAITCLFVRAGFRKQGWTWAMVEAAVRYAGEQGARLVEAYPVATMPGDLSAGTLATFLDCGFTVYARDRTTSKRNVVVRRPLGPDARALEP